MKFPPVLAAVALLHASLAPLSGQTQTYRLTDIGIPTGRQISHPAAININGWVAGSSEWQAFRYINGVMEELGTLEGGTLSTGAAINSSGDVAGASTFTDGGNIRHATLFNINGNFDLGTLPNWGNYSFATGMNDFTEIVGYSGPTSSPLQAHAFIWDSTNGMRDLGTLGGQYAHASSINNSGVATGAAQIGTAFGNFHAFIWDAANGMRDIGTIAGDTSSGTFINANSHIVGSSTINNFDNRQHAFLYDGATMRDLGSLGGNVFESDRSSARGINLYDQVVGSSYRPYQGGALYGVAFVYREAQMFDLEKLVDASGADYRLHEAVAVNDYGQITVDAVKISTNQTRAVLLTPNPNGKNFTNIIDSTTPGFTAFGAWPSINDNGAVAFYAENNGSGAIYRANPNASPILISPGGNGAPSINNAGEVLSTRYIEGAALEIYKTTDGQTFQQVARTGLDYRSFPGLPFLSENGRGVFYANRNPVSPTRRGIYTGDGTGSTNLVTDNAGTFNDFGSSPSMNAAGLVAFSAFLDTPGGAGIYLGNQTGNGATTPVVTEQSAPLYGFDGSPFINDDGQIAFLGRESSSNGASLFIINQDGTGLRKIADVAGPFSALGSPSINNSNSFVFRASLDKGGHGIFNGPDAGANKVIAEGDPLFGSTVQSVGFFRGLNDKDEIVFSYTLTDGRKGIAKTTLAPPADLVRDKPQITRVERLDGKTRITFTAPAGRSYKLQRSTRPDGALGWSTVAGASNVPGNGGERTVEDPTPPGTTSSFYRVLVLAW